MSPDDPRHGTYAGGRVHRADHEDVCDPCAYAEARYERARQLDNISGRPRTMPCLGTRRRLQALVALGHSFGRIAEALEMTPAGAWALGTRPRAYVRAVTVAKVTTLYDAWSMLLPPTDTGNQRKAANYARTVATKHGWLPPLAWDDIDHDPEPAETGPDQEIDWVVVERILAGDHALATAATLPERRVVVARWPHTGRPYNDLARLTGWKVERYHDQEDAA